MNDLTESERAIESNLSLIASIHKTIRLDSDGEISFRTCDAAELGPIKYKQIASGARDNDVVVSYLEKKNAQIRQHRGDNYYRVEVAGFEFLWPTNKASNKKQEKTNDGNN